MMRALILPFLTFTAVLVLSFPATAQIAGTGNESPGGDCSGYAAGSVLLNPDTDNDTVGTLLRCNGATWEPVPVQAINDSGSCTAEKDGVIKYNAAADPPFEYCDGGATTWRPFKQPRCTDDDTGECYLDATRANDDPDFIAANIRAGVNILGVTGMLRSCPSYGLVAHWTLDETSGTLTDASGNGNDGSAQNNPSYAQPGIITSAMGFDGSDDHVTHGLSLPRNAGTISHWLNPDQLRRMVAYYEAGGTDGKYNGFQDADDVLEIHTSIEATGEASFVYQDGTQALTAEGLESTTQLQAGVWTHVAVTWNRAGDIVLYVNGVAEDTRDISGITYSNNAVAVRQLGRTGNGDVSRHWDGRMDDVRVYDRPLTSAEISDLYNGGENCLSGVRSPCADSPTPGTLCADGSIYAGTIDGDGSGPGGDVKLFIPPYDLDNSPHTAPNLMSDGVTNRGTFVYKVNRTESSVEECGSLNDNPACHDGQTLTEQLVNGTGPDGPNNPEEHHAAIACDNLSFGGKSDWYLPSIQELTMIWQNLADGAPDSEPDDGISDDFNFDISGNLYWSSSEFIFPGSARRLRFSDGEQGDFNTDNTFAVRCARRE